MNSYIPYSKRHNISDPDLAGLLDYLERMLGEEFSLTEGEYEWEIYFRDSWYTQLTIHKFKRHLMFLSYSQNAFGVSMPTEAFFRTYKTLLPVIRDLYSK